MLSRLSPTFTGFSGLGSITVSKSVFDASKGEQGTMTITGATPGNLLVARLHASGSAGRNSTQDFIWDPEFNARADQNGRAVIPFRTGFAHGLIPGRYHYEWAEAPLEAIRGTKLTESPTSKARMLGGVTFDVISDPNVPAPLDFTYDVLLGGVQSLAQYRDMVASQIDVDPSQVPVPELVKFLPESDYMRTGKFYDVATAMSNICQRIPKIDQDYSDCARVRYNQSSGDGATRRDYMTQAAGAGSQPDLYSSAASLVSAAAPSQTTTTTALTPTIVTDQNLVKHESPAPTAANWSLPSFDIGNLLHSAQSAAGGTELPSWALLAGAGVLALLLFGGHGQGNGARS